jgi:transcriptional regulator with XRE-family HTH domain
MSKIQSLFAANLRKIRESLGWSQAYLAEKAELSTNYIQQLEGEHKFPRKEAIDQIADAFGLDVSALFSRDVDFSPNMKQFKLAALDSMGNSLNKFITDQKKALEAPPTPS